MLPLHLHCLRHELRQFILTLPSQSPPPHTPIRRSCFLSHLLSAQWGLFISGTLIKPSRGDTLSSILWATASTKPTATYHRPQKLIITITPHPEISRLCPEGQEALLAISLHCLLPLLPLLQLLPLPLLPPLFFRIRTQIPCVWEAVETTCQRQSVARMSSHGLHMCVYVTKGPRL